MEHQHIKKLYRSRTDRVVSGVLAGIGKYAAVDATIVRVIFIITAVITGIVPLAFAYLVLALVVPEEKGHTTPTYDETGKRIY